MSDSIDPRALIAIGLEHEERMTPGEWQYGLAGLANLVCFDGDDITGVADAPRGTNRAGIAWLRNNARAILQGWSQAMDEVDRLRADEQSAAGECLVPVDQMTPGSHLRRVVLANRMWRYERDSLRAEAVTLRTELGECRLVIEQQDRDLERMQAAAELSRSGAAEAVCDSDRLRNENERLRGGLTMLRGFVNDKLNHYRLSAAIDAILERKP